MFKPKISAVQSMNNSPQYLQITPSNALGYNTELQYIRHDKVWLSPSLGEQEHLWHLPTRRRKIWINELVAGLECPLRNNLLTVSNYRCPFWTIDQLKYGWRHREQRRTPHGTSKSRRKIGICSRLRGDRIQYTLFNKHLASNAIFHAPCNSIRQKHKTLAVMF